MRTLEEKFLATTMPIPESGCLIWMGALADGYGRIHLGAGKTIGAHRYSWEVNYGKIPEGICVCHKCDVPSCVNHEHLFLADNYGNLMDKINKNRQARGLSHGRAKLTEEMVKEILLSNLKHTELAKKFGVAANSIRLIRTGRNWKHIPRPS